jgi:hypothetical protein
MPRRQVPRTMCPFCRNTYARSGMTRHLKACKALKAAIAPDDAAGGPKTRFFHLMVEGTYNPVYWLHLKVPTDATLYDLDSFLRGMWLECCGHLSMFEIMGRRFQSTIFDSWWGDDDLDMDFELSRVLSPGVKFSHEYDFGTTTYLTLRVISEWEGVAGEEERIQVLARNEPPDYRCEVCGEPATVICVFCDYTLLCDKCIEAHECGDEGLLPVVNSPRMGMCGYTGDAW